MPERQLSDAMTSSEVAGAANGLALAALLRRLVVRAALTPQDVSELMAESREQAARGFAGQDEGDFGLRSILQALHAIEDLAGTPPRRSDSLGR